MASAKGHNKVSQRQVSRARFVRFLHHCSGCGSSLEMRHQRKSRVCWRTMISRFSLQTPHTHASQWLTNSGHEPSRVTSKYHRKHRKSNTQRLTLAWRPAREETSDIFQFPLPQNVSLPGKMCCRNKRINCIVLSEQLSEGK